MPNIENLERRNITNRFTKPTITAQRDEVLYKSDIKTAFGYAITGIFISLAVAGIAYTVGRKLIA
jgi:hypothetical protein